MTVVVGLKAGRSIWMGSDSAATSDDFSKSNWQPKKIFILKNEFLIGYSSSFRAGQIIEHAFTPPDSGNLRGMRYLTTKFIPAMIKTLEKQKFDLSENDSEFLLGWRSKLYQVQCDFSLFESIDGYAAIGSGESYAVSALYTYKSLNIKGVQSKKYIEMALNAAANFNGAVSGPYYYEKI